MTKKRALLLLVGLAGCSAPPDLGSEATATSPQALQGANNGVLSPGKKVKVSQEFALSTSTTPGPGSGLRSAVALGDTQHLVTWFDDRAEETRLYAARVALDGAVLDPLGIPLLDQEVTHASVGFDGTHFLVVVAGGGQARGIRVSGAGEVLDPGGFPIATGGFPNALAAGFDGASYLVAWSRAGGVYSTRITPDGTVLDPGGVLAAAGPVCGPIDLSFDGTNHFLTWRAKQGGSGYQIRGARVSPLGVALDPSGIAISPVLAAPPYAEWCEGSPLGPTTSFDGANHVVVWPDFAPPLDPPMGLIVAARVTPQGSVLDPGGIVAGSYDRRFERLSRVDSAFDGARTTIAWSAQDVSAGWNVMAPVRITQLDPGGSVIAPPVDSLDPGHEVAIASSGAGVLATWTAIPPESQYTHAIAGMRLDPQGATLDPQALALSTNGGAQRVRSAASSSHVSFTLWKDARVGLDHYDGLVGARVKPSGKVLDPVGIPIPGASRVDGASTVFDGESFLVLWTNALAYYDSSFPRLRGVRVSPDGAVLDAEPIELPLCSYSLEMTPVAASDGTHTLIVGDRCPDTSSGGGMEAILVDQQGVVVSVVGLPEIADFWVDYRVVFDGTNYVISWHNYWQAFLWRVSPQGELLDGEFSPISDDYPMPIHAMALGSDGDNALVVWHTDGGIYGRRFSPSGQPLDPQGVLIAEPLQDPAYFSGCTLWGTGAGACPSVVFDGADFIVAWRSMAIPGDPSSLDLHGTRVRPSGAVMSTFTLSDEPWSEGPAALTSTGNGKVLAAYSRFDPEAPYSALRAQARTIKAPGH